MMTKICEKERTQDIFSIYSKNEIVYYGGRNKGIYRIHAETMEPLNPLHPQHYGAVNVLCNLNDTLISGCREYLLRAWDYETGKQKYAEVKRSTLLNAV